MASRDTSASDLAAEAGIEPGTLRRSVGPEGALREHGQHLLDVTTRRLATTPLPPANHPISGGYADRAEGGDDRGAGALPDRKRGCRRVEDGGVA